MHYDTQSRPASGRIAVVSVAISPVMDGHRETQLFCSLRGWNSGTVVGLFTQAIARCGATAVRFRWRALGMTPSGATMTDEIEQLREDLEQLRERYEQETKQLRNNIQQLHEEMVATAAVERVLLEYGIDTDTVDAILEDIEAVDSRLRSGDDE